MDENKSAFAQMESRPLVAKKGVAPVVEAVYYQSTADHNEKAGQGILLKEDASFFVICLVIFAGDTARGVLFPTLYPRISAMGGNRVTQGITVGRPPLRASDHRPGKSSC